MPREKNHAAAPVPAHGPPGSSAQEPSTVPEAREKTPNVSADPETQYPRQGSNLRPTV